jgi:hypothetical protein
LEPLKEKFLGKRPTVSHFTSEPDIIRYSEIAAPKSGFKRYSSQAGILGTVTSHLLAVSFEMPSKALLGEYDAVPEAWNGPPVTVPFPRVETLMFSDNASTENRDIKTTIADNENNDTFLILFKLLHYYNLYAWHRQVSLLNRQYSHREAKTCG